MKTPLCAASLLAAQLMLALAVTAAAPDDSDAPYIDTFHRKGKTLTYVAATHHSQVQYPDALQDPVFKTVKYAFEKSPPGAAIVEGIHPSDLQGFIGYAKHCAASKYADTYCSEPAYTAQLALAKGAHIYTGEPSARAVLSYFESHGYTINDYLGFIMMRQIPYAKTRSDLNAREMLNTVIRQQQRLLGTSVQFTVDRFAQWYAKHMQAPRDYMDLTSEDGSPYISNGSESTTFHALGLE